MDASVVDLSALCSEKKIEVTRVGLRVRVREQWIIWLQENNATEGWKAKCTVMMKQLGFENIVTTCEGLEKDFFHFCDAGTDGASFIVQSFTSVKFVFNRCQ